MNTHRIQIDTSLPPAKFNAEALKAAQRANAERRARGTLEERKALYRSYGWNEENADAMARIDFFGAPQ